MGKGIEGIGVMVVPQLLVVHVLPGGPAERAGLKEGDRIMKVNSHSTVPPDYIRDLIKGMPVRIMIERDNKDKEIVIENLTVIPLGAIMDWRDEQLLQSVRVENLPWSVLRRGKAGIVTL